MADHNTINSMYRNLLVLQPQNEHDTNEMGISSDVKVEDISGAKEKLDERIGWRSCLVSDVHAEKILSALGHKDSWRRVDITDFKPFYDKCNSRIYRYAPNPPSPYDNQDEKPCNLYEQSNSNALTKKLLSKQKEERNSGSNKMMMEKWCIFDQHHEHLSQYDGYEKGSRYHSILVPSEPDVCLKNVWKRVSRGILDQELPNTNACYKITENVVHIFYFENKEKAVKDWLENEFSGVIKLQKL